MLTWYDLFSCEDTELPSGESDGRSPSFHSTNNLNKFRITRDLPIQPLLCYNFVIKWPDVAEWFKTWTITQTYQQVYGSNPDCVRIFHVTKTQLAFTSEHYMMI